MLHAIATGNMTPGWVKIVCVDINPAVATKVSDRGTGQAIGVVTDVGLFLDLLAKTMLEPSTAGQLEEGIRQSILMARRDPDAALPYIRSCAQEMTADVLRAHIDTFVNEFSLDLGDKGREAVDVLERHAREAGILS